MRPLLLARSLGFLSPLTVCWCQAASCNTVRLRGMAGRAASPPVLQKMAFGVLCSAPTDLGEPRLGASGSERSPLPCFAKSSLGRLRALWGADFTFCNRCAETVFQSLPTSAIGARGLRRPQTSLTLAKRTSQSSVRHLLRRRERGAIFCLPSLFRDVHATFLAREKLRPVEF